MLRHLYPPMCKGLGVVRCYAAYILQYARAWAFCDATPPISSNVEGDGLHSCYKRCLFICIHTSLYCRNCFLICPSSFRRLPWNWFIVRISGYVYTSRECVMVPLVYKKAWLGVVFFRLIAMVSYCCTVGVRC